MYRKILFINPFGIGDVLFTTGCVHSVKVSLGNVSVGYLCNRRSEALIRANPFVDRVHVYERDEFALIRQRSFLGWVRRIHALIDEIKSEHYDSVFDLSLNIQYGYFSWAAGIKKRIGYDFKRRGIYLNRKTPLFAYEDKHIVEYYADLMRVSGVDPVYLRPEIFIPPKDLKSAEDLLIANGVKGGLMIAVVPAGGGSWGNSAFLKHWPPEYFAGLCDKIIDNFKCSIIILGSAQEKPVSAKVLAALKGKVLDLTGQTSLMEMAAILSKMRLVVANDGGPLHLAAASGVKTVSFFGPVNERVYGPYPCAPDHLVLTAASGCRPCYKRFRLAPCLENLKCLRSIKPDDVFEKIKYLLHDHKEAE